MKKVAMFALLYTALLITAFWYREPLWDWVNQTHYNQLPLMFLLAILFSMIPIVPFSVFAGLMGAKFGVLVGATINWTGSVGAAILFFVLVRYFFVEQFQLYISRFDKVQKFDQIIGRNGFIAVLFSRLIPIIPTPVVNIYSGLSPILFSQYMMATAIGQIPDTVVFAYLGKQLFTSVQSTVIVILIYVLFLLIVFVFYYWWYKSGSVKSQ